MKSTSNYLRLSRNRKLADSGSQNGSCDGGESLESSEEAKQREMLGAHGTEGCNCPTASYNTRGREGKRKSDWSDGSTSTKVREIRCFHASEENWKWGRRPMAWQTLYILYYIQSAGPTCHLSRCRHDFTLWWSTSFLSFFEKYTVYINKKN